jgi:hypothetical protein
MSAEGAADVSNYDKEAKRPNSRPYQRFYPLSGFFCE